jgi:hypothetical protein
MKKKLTALLMTAVLVTQAFIPCIAADDDINVFINDEARTEITAYEQDDAVMVSLRPALETLGYNIEWNSETQCVRATRGSDEINMYVDFQTYWVNGTAVSTKNPPHISDGRMFLSSDDLSTVTGYSVDYTSDAKSLYIDTAYKSDTAETVTTEETAAPEETATPEPSQSPEPSATPQIKPIALNVNTVSVKEGKTYQFKTTVKTTVADKTIVWRSSDENIATVDSNGLLTAVNDGTCTIVAKAGSYSDSCEVTVTNVPKEPEISIIGFNTTNLFKDGSNYVTITIHNNGKLPLIINGNATYYYKSEKKVWSAKLACDTVIIDSKSNDTITFRRTDDEPTATKTSTSNFYDNLQFKFVYDGKEYTGKKTKQLSDKEKESSTSSTPAVDFSYS